MKIRTNVKAGASDGRSYITGYINNHNEKLAASDSTEQNGITKKLRLSKETIRDLKAGRILNCFELVRAAGGAAISGPRLCRTECICNYTY